MDSTIDLNNLEILDREDLIAIINRMVNGGVSLSFHGKRTAMEIARRVRPRVVRRLKEFHVGNPEEQCKNLLIEGENLQSMVTLYKFRGQVDLIVTDPPYNTGQYFRYNDRWEEDPNDPELGQLVTLDDGSRHTKWMKAMLPRLQMMKSMLKPQGVLAICIDDNELYHLGLMLDEVFGEQNRLGIINWQKTTSKNDAKHLATTTEYVLVYSNNIELTKTEMFDRSRKSNIRFSNVDNDLKGNWKQDNLTAASGTKNSAYFIQSPFTGELHSPGTRYWAYKKSTMKEWLEDWGSSYQELDMEDGNAKALVLKGWKIGSPKSEQIIDEARQKANVILNNGNWPYLYFGHDGLGKPVRKTYEYQVKSGAVPVSFWLNDDEDFEPIKLESSSWHSYMSGRSRDGVEELSKIVGKDHGFQTVKPLKLIKKIIQLWCPPQGLVLDPYAGSGTTGHAVLELNKETGSERCFILIEQGRPDNGDKYARTLTWQRLKNAITGERPCKPNEVQSFAEPLGGGFEFRMLTSQIDAKTVLSMKKDELIDVVITSHWDSSSRNASNLIRIEDSKFSYLVGKSLLNEGYFIIWNNGGPVGQLDVASYNLVLQDAKKANLKPPYHIYARYELYQSKNVRFYKIPDKILAHLGLNENSDSFNDDNEENI